MVSPADNSNLPDELVDPETAIHVLLWYTSTEQSAERYLSKMSHMMEAVGLQPEMSHHEVGAAGQNEIGFRFAKLTDTE